MPEPIVVQRIALEAVTGDTPYPGENGFFAAWARVTSSEPGVVEQLSLAQDGRRPVALRCGYLVVSGVPTRRESEGASTTFTLSVDEVTGRNSNKAGNS